ncbi:hypothetical protein KY360_05200 [Candidatus Woesearchaeota archaeon]|nr:hypothetical protein [Candidatus Woesearchaeota archaeon]
MEKEDYQKLVAVGILTDGSFRIKKCRNTQLIEFYSNDSLLHLTFQECMRKGFGRDNTSYFHRDKNRYRSNGSLIITGYELSKKDNIVKVLKELSPTYKTKENSNPQPSIRFLLSQKDEVKELAVRFAMSCDGCVSVAHLKSGKIQASLKFACAHPILVYEWKKLFSDVGINTCLDKDRANWSNIHGLISSKKRSIMRLQEIGGFYPRPIKVQNGNYKGLHKNQVLNGICEWFKDKKSNIDALISRNKI